MKLARWPAGPRLLVLSVPTLAALLAAFTFGPYSLTPGEVLAALLAGPAATGDAATVVWNLRLPRIAAGLLVGMALAAAGAAYQGMFRNPLASPDILGVSAGAGLGASLAILYGLPLAAVQGAAFCGGLLAVGSVYFVAGRVRRHDPVLILVLAGVAVGTLFGAGISLVKVLADPSAQLPSITFWLLGGLNAAAPTDLALAAPLVAIGLVPMLLLRWQVNLLALSDEEAAAMGVNVTRLRLVLISSATLIAATAVSIAGIIGWVGLVVPHAARLLVGPEFSRLLPAVLLLGGGFLVAADTLARSVTVIELPLGILTAFVGAPVFLWLLARTGRRG
ncbi:FecCD family ABC transporter permease [Azonexus hydrophilus]|uniref:FecCD family ABC transporter permease n=1 Tax=Azonexus hydrophilus TaxID=418702 RepID=UPI0019647517|nr:iron ABC transporter permease [Azonexus hydrophilus]MBV2193941.1 iron ABC transporter permease [Azonexus sp.]